MKDIRFRGKPVKPYGYTIKEDGTKYIDFEYGGFYRDFCYGGCPEGKDYIICFNSTGMGYNEHVLVEKGSVGQYIGLKDKNKTSIYDNDLVKAINRNYDCEDDREKYFQTFEITYLNGCFMFGNWNAQEFFNKFMFIEVVGNTFDNKGVE